MTSDDLILSLKSLAPNLEKKKREVKLVAVVVAQLVERPLPIPDIYLLSTEIEKDEHKGKIGREWPIFSNMIGSNLEILFIHFCDG